MVRRAVIVLVVGILQATLMAGIAQGQSSDLSDEFDSLDETRWSKGDHNLGRSYLDPNNVGANGGNLEIKLPANSLNGGEIKSQGLYGHGSYAARIKVPHAPSSITGFFLYEPPDYASEIDVEIYNDSSRRIMFTTYSGGKQTHTQTMTLPFDPTGGFHDYRFDYAPNSVSFYADGRLMKRWKGGVPNKPMRLYVNAWFPTWLEGQSPGTDRFVLVDEIGYAARLTVDAVSTLVGETGVQRNVNVTATFSEEMDPTSIVTDPTEQASSTVRLYQKHRYQVRKKRKGKVRRVWAHRWVPVSASVSCNSACRTATLDPSGDLVADAYYLAVITTEAKDKAGNHLPRNYSWIFTTGSG